MRNRTTLPWGVDGHDLKKWETISPMTLRPVLTLTKNARKLLEAERILRDEGINNEILRKVVELLNCIDATVVSYARDEKLITERANARRIKKKVE